VASRYMIIEFDEEAPANKLRAQIDNATKAGKPFRVVGLFAKPTHYCDCGVDKWTGTKSQPATTKRGRKFGWWVCIECRRPAASISGLVNQINPDDIINPPTFDLKNGVGNLIFHIMSLSAVTQRKP